MRKHGALIGLGVILVAAVWGLFSGPAQATPGDPHKVWVCKYVQTPGSSEVLKGGKNPIQVDVAATVGSWFKDGQVQSYVLAEATDENTGHPGNDYTGGLTCPTGDPEPTPTTTDPSYTSPPPSPKP